LRSGWGISGQGSRPPAGGQGPRKRDEGGPGRLPAVLIRPGPVNICLCNLFVLTGFLAPLALAFAFLFADTEGRWLQSHYHYLRTTVALFVIGGGLGGLMILFGAPLSSGLMLAGLGLITATLLLTAARSLAGFYCSLRGLPLRNHETFLL
jgi:uncharacterized membrane protein